MRKILTTNPDFGTLDGEQNLWVYNALDSAVTLEVLHAIQPMLDPDTSKIYAFSRALQAPVLHMMLRGIRIDQAERKEFIEALQDKITFLEERLNQLGEALWGKPINARSPKALAELFYKALRLPVRYKRRKDGSRSVSTDREALESFEEYPRAKIFVSHILAIREYGKLVSAIRSEVDPDGRMRTSINIAGTETGRFSSSSSAHDTGTNLQNQTEELRRLFVADPGTKLAYIDLEQAESRTVGLICKELGFGEAYLEACLSGDLHTTTCRLVWPDLPWTGDLKHDKELAERPFYRHFSYRDMSKRGGHGTNYYGTPWTMAKHLKVETKLIEDFQRTYFRAFPEIRRWHKWVAQQIQTTGKMTTLLGRKRTFFGRVNDDTTLREAIAYEPQSIIGDYMNSGLLLVHHKLPEVDLLLQVHDALLIQYNPKDEPRVIPEARRLISLPTIGKSRLTIPNEVKVGWNWGKVSAENPWGLQKYSGVDNRQYRPTSLLDRVIR